MCLIIKEHYKCCPDNIYQEYMLKCALSQHAACRDGCIYQRLNRAKLAGEDCMACRTRNRVMEWLRGLKVLRCMNRVSKGG
jgi:hypothetical protein